MNERQQHPHGPGAGGDAAGTPTGGANLEQARQRATAFYAAADDAIRNVLSGDSAKFNQSARQEGGQ